MQIDTSFLGPVRVQEKEGRQCSPAASLVQQVRLLPPSPPGGLSTRDSLPSRSKRVQEGAAPRAAPRKCGAAQAGKTPVLAGAAPAPMQSPLNADRHLVFLAIPRSLAPAVFPLSRWPVPIDAEHLGLRGKARLGVTPGRGVAFHSPPRPSLFAELVDRRVASGDRRSKVSGAGACSAGDRWLLGMRPALSACRGVGAASRHSVQRALDANTIHQLFDQTHGPTALFLLRLLILPGSVVAG
jgi:hypothetical protein